MDPIRFEWDAAKARANLRKHGVSFEEAETAFYDDHAVISDDPDHSDAREERFLLLGMSSALRVLIVVHCYRESDAVIRLLSARRATRSERAQYDARWKP